MQVWDLNRIDRSSRIFNFSLQSSFVFLKERTTFVVEPERICQNFMGRSHLVFCRLSIEYSACFNRSFTPYQCDQFCLTGNSFRKNRIACPDAVRSVCIASPIPGFLYFSASFLAPSFDSADSHALKASIKSNRLISSGDL